MVTGNIPPSDTGTPVGHQRTRTRSRCTPTPTMPCALLLMASLVQHSSSAGAEGTHGANPRPQPPIITGLSRRADRGHNAGGGRDRDGDTDTVNGNDRRGNREVIPPSLYTPVDASHSLSRQQGSTRSTTNDRANNHLDNDQSMGSSTSSSNSSSNNANYPAGVAAPGLGGSGNGRLASGGPLGPSLSSLKPVKNVGGFFTRPSNGYSGRSVHNAHQHETLAAARQAALAAGGRPAHGLRPVLFEHRAGGGGDSVGDNEQEQEDQAYFFEPKQDREPYTNYQTKGRDHEYDGALSEDRPNIPRAPAPLQTHPGHLPGSQPRTSTLFRRAGGGGVFFVFFILVWRSLSNYENVEQMSGFMRRTMYVPAIGLFLGNLVCMCLSLVQSVTTRQKARMKTMITIDAVAEGVLLSYNLLRLLGGSGEAQIAREEFISRLLANAWFLSICFTFAKARWVAEGTW